MDMKIIRLSTLESRIYFVNYMFVSK